MSFSDAFQTFSQVDTYYSANYIEDPRQLVCQTRSHSGDYLNGNMQTLAQWAALVTGGGASITVQEPGEGGTGNPSGQYVWQLSTGPVIGTDCHMAMTIASLPPSYGVMCIPDMVSNSGLESDAVYVLIQDAVDNAELQLYFSGAGLQVATTSGLTLLSSHYTPAGCEWWLEVKSNSPGNLTIGVYAGTQLINTVTVSVPIGNPVNAGLVCIKQLCGSTTNQVLQMINFNIGTTQLPDDAVIQSVSYPLAFNASSLNFSFMVEGICDNTVIGTDFTAQVCVGGTWQGLTLTNQGTHFNGIVDYTKPVYEVTASYTPKTPIPQGTEIAYKAHMLNGKMMALLGVQMIPTSIY